MNGRNEGWRNEKGKHVHPIQLPTRPPTHIHTLSGIENAAIILVLRMRLGRISVVPHRGGGVKKLMQLEGEMERGSKGRG